MTQMISSIDAGGLSESTPLPEMREIVDEHYEFIWRSIRRLGVPMASIDDAAQQVFMIASRKVEAILPGREKAFLFGIALRVASDARRTAQREIEHGRELADAPESDLVGEGAPLADELLDRKRMRARLDAFLDELSDDVRTAFVLYEGEGMTVPEIAEMVAVPIGTVASRIRLARKQFNAMVERLRLAEQRGAAR